MESFWSKWLCSKCRLGGERYCSDTVMALLLPAFQGPAGAHHDSGSWLKVGLETARFSGTRVPEYSTPPALSSKLAGSRFDSDSKHQPAHHRPSPTAACPVSSPSQPPLWPSSKPPCCVPGKSLEWSACSRSSVSAYLLLSHPVR